MKNTSITVVLKFHGNNTLQRKDIVHLLLKVAKHWSLDLHIVWDFRFDTYHNTFFDFWYVSTIQIYVEIPQEPRNIAQSIQKHDLPLYQPVLESNKNPIRGYFCWGIPVSRVFTPENWQNTTKIIKKMRRVMGVEHSNDMFFYLIWLSNCRKTVLSIYLKPICIPIHFALNVLKKSS